MEAVLAATLAAGAEVLNECRVERLVMAPDGRVVGVAGRHEREPFYAKARRGVRLLRP